MDEDECDYNNNCQYSCVTLKVHFTVIVTKDTSWMEMDTAVMTSMSVMNRMVDVNLVVVIA